MPDFKNINLKIKNLIRHIFGQGIQKNDQNYISFKNFFLRKTVNLLVFIFTLKNTKDFVESDQKSLIFRQKMGYVLS